MGQFHFIKVTEEPCEWCAIWMGPHLHGVRSDGSLGLIVLGKEEATRLGYWEEGDSKFIFIDY